MEDQIIGTVEKYGYLLEREFPTSSIAMSGSLESDEEGNLVPEGARFHPTRLYEKDGMVMATFEQGE